MPIDSAELAAALRQAKNKPMFFAFVAKGTEGQLLVDKKKISPKEITDAKKECGGGTIYSGRCHDENGVLVFEVLKEPPGTLAGQIKKIIKRDASLTLNVEVRVNANADSEDGETASAASTADSVPPPPPPAPPVDGAAVIKRLNALAGGMKAALAGQDAARVQTLFAAVTGLVKNKDFVQAGTVLDELEPLVAKAAALPAPSPPPQTPPKPTAPVDPLAEQFANRLKALAPLMKQAGPGGAALVQQAQQQVVEGNRLYLAKQYQAANESLDRAEGLIKQALAHSEKGQASAQDTTAVQAEWERRIIALEPRVLEAKKLRPNEARWMTLFMSAQDTGAAGDFVAAMRILDDLETRLSAAPPAAEPPGLSVTQLAKARLDWIAARSKAVQEVQRLQAALQNEYQNDPNEQQTLTTALGTLEGIFADVDESLADQLDAVLNAEAPQPNLSAQAKATLEKFTTFMDTDPLMKLLDGNEVLPDTQVTAPLRAKLQNIAAALG